MSALGWILQTLAAVVRDAIDPDLELESDDPRAGDAEHPHPDISTATDLLGYEPTTGIREGVATVIDWYHENQNWDDPLVRQS